MYLDNINPYSVNVNFGEVGVAGQMGYANLVTSVRGIHYQHSFSAHTPSKLCFHLDPEWQSFRCRVAMNDSAAANIWADFLVYADDELVAVAAHVKTNEPPRELFCNLYNATNLKLEVWVDSAENSSAYSHAVWLDPILSHDRLETILAPFGRASLPLPEHPMICERVIFTVITPDYYDFLVDMLSSLYANSMLQDATLVVFGFELDNRCRDLLSRHNAYFVACSRGGGMGLALKSAAFSVAHVIRAKHYLFLDADLVITGDLRPLYDSLAVSQPDRILIGHEMPRPRHETLGEALLGWYHGTEEDLAALRVTQPERQSRLTVNSGVFSGSRRAIMGLDNMVRSLMPYAAFWENEKKPVVWWREQGLVNIALARMGCAMELDPVYNCQLLYNEIDVQAVDGTYDVTWQGRPVKIMHFNGPQNKYKFPELRRHWREIPNARFGDETRSQFETFTSTLTQWHELIGPNAMSQSFYPQVDTAMRYERQPGYSLYKVLYDHIHNAKSTRVIDIGTRRGITAAVCACALTKNADTVVTVGEITEEAKALWNLLPGHIGHRIESRPGELLTTVKRLAREQEGRFDVAVMDSHQHEQATFTQFLLASRLVHENGHIVVQDFISSGYDFENVMRRIIDEGFRMVVHECVERDGVSEVHAKLIIVQNRRYARVEKPDDL